MSGIGPVEPGEGTRGTPSSRPPRGRLAARCDRHRRAVVAGATACALLAGGGYLYATRPRPQAPPLPPYPSQVVDIGYLGRAATRADEATRAFGFEVLLGVTSGPPVTVTRIAQPYAGLSVTSAPRPPFRTKAGSSRKIIITMRVTECGKVPENAGLPFLDVTLRNARAIQVHSFILGPRYARHLSEALQVACSNSSV
ncbi:Tat pathway signal sequence domain protein [Streptomyces sp. DH24]|uniref:Tat pathway signal sequence domain protein n=1 Tax=Streptomyces sp. DH24 TaxID=3040123 RepID=UPI0024433F30|nr:Tat pathway signal sequence domain protein [Streptomyces sp. DH24]MDG9715261.1 Tat pathway signal sequence domain protein [Streptomyces sp. DH24]